jgi:signal transduction histidine kinase
VNAWAYLWLLVWSLVSDVDWGNNYLNTTTEYLAGIGLGLAVAGVNGFLLRFPDRRLSPSHRRWIAAQFAILPIIYLLDRMTSQPTDVGDPPGSWWTIPTSVDLYGHVVFPLEASLDLIVGVGTTVLQARRWRQSRGKRRPGQAAMLAGSIVLLMMVLFGEVVLVPGYWTRDWSGYQGGWHNWINIFASGAEPSLLIVSFLPLVEVFQRRSAEATIPGRLLAAACNGAGPDLDAAVTVALGDPSAQVVEASAAPADTDSPLLHQILSVESDGGEPLARLVIDPAAGFCMDEQLVAAVLTTVRSGLINHNLRAAQQQLSADLAESRARMVEAALEERRRAERDLHDSVQQALLGVTAVLARASLIADDQVPALVTEAAERLQRTQTDLDRMVLGLRPVALALGGLARALPVLAAGSTIQVRLTTPDPPDDSLAPDTVEATAYFVASEGLANAVKHSHASLVDIRLAVDDGLLVVSVADDGVGGARIDPGGGLAGLQDRLRRHGGDLEVGASRHGGTELTARIPY